MAELCLREWRAEDPLVIAPSVLDGFLGAAERVAAGGSALDPQAVARLLGGTGPLTELSDRERQVLELVAEGRTNAGIASALHLSERTVESRISRVFSSSTSPKA